MWLGQPRGFKYNLVKTCLILEKKNQVGILGNYIY